MPAPIADRQGERGRKHSLWVSAPDYRRVTDAGQTVGEVFRRGLDATPDLVAVPEGLEEALDLVARVSVALKNGGRITYSGGQDPVPYGESAERESAAWRDGYETAANTEDPRSETARRQFEVLLGRPLRDRPAVLLDYEVVQAAAAIAERHGHKMEALTLKNLANGLRNTHGGLNPDQEKVLQDFAPPKATQVDEAVERIEAKNETPWSGGAYLPPSRTGEV
jgi:hypothetical protein